MSRVFHFVLILIGVVIIDLGNAEAVPIGELGIYHRCHAQLTRTRPPADDLRLVKIQNGSLKAPQACMELLAIAKINKDGILENHSNEMQQTAIKVLQNIQSLHASWFPQKDLVQDEVDGATFHLYDTNEMGYHLTFNLLNDAARASDLLTRKTSYRAIRTSSHNPIYFVDNSSPSQIKKIAESKWYLGENENINELTPIKPNLVQFGQLIGFSELIGNENTFNYLKKDKTSLKFDLTSSLGAGILGTRSYILLNTGQKPNQLSDGGLNSHRSWSKAVFQDLLCRNLPVVKPEDVINTYKTSNLSFRKSKTCMQCHVSIDPMADTVRNVFETRSMPKNLDGVSVRILAEHQPTMQSEIKTVDQDPNFHLRPPRGQLYFRSYQNKLVSEKVNSVQELGEALSKTDDFYICITKKYFEYFTGVSVDLDPLAVENSLNQNYKEHKEFVIKTGLQFKKDQSLKNVLQNILSSSFYSDSNFGVVK